MNEIAYTDPGSIDGLLEWDRWEWTLTDLMIDDFVVLVFSAAMKHRHLIPIVEQCRGKRVTVVGMIRYAKGKPKSIAVESIELLPEEKDIPKYKDIPAIDVTGGVESYEWLMGQREE